MTSTVFVDYSPATPIVASWLNDVNTTVYTLPTSSGASLVGIKRTDLSGAVTTTLALWNNQQWINARAAYGITANGTADDSVLFQAMATDAASVGRVVYLGSGTYRLTTTITSTPVLYVGDGGGKTKIIFDTLTGINGFTFNSSSTVGMTGGFIGVEFIAKGANGATAIECPKVGNQYDTYFTHWIFRDLYMHGNTRNAAAYGFAWDYSFTNWIRAADCDGLTIENVTIQGSFDIKLDPSPQFKDCGIKLDATSTLLTGRIRNIAIGPIYMGIAVGDNVFFSIETFDLIGTYRGIYQTGTTEFSEPKITNGNINCQETGIYLDSSSARDISSVTIRRHSSGWKSATNDWYGIKASNLSSLTLSRNLVQPDESGGAFSGTMYAYALTAISQSAASDNTVGVGCDIGFQLDNCTGLSINGTVSNQNDAANTLFNLVNNTRASAVGTYSLVSTFVGTLIAKDGTIVDAINMINESFDLQGTGAVNRDTTRVNGAADSKKWRETTGTTTQNRQILSDALAATNYELVTRSTTTVSSIEWRGTLLYLNGTTSQTKQLNPVADNTYNLGTGSFRWGQLFAGTATINTSDEREKQDIGDIDPAVLRAMGKINFKQFRFRDAVERKANAARIHFGVIAQEVKAAFESEGLDPFNYGVLCYDEWDDQPEVLDEEGSVVMVYQPAGNRYGVRYDELFALKLAALESTLS